MHRNAVSMHDTTHGSQTNRASVLDGSSSIGITVRQEPHQLATQTKRRAAKIWLKATEGGIFDCLFEFR